MMEHSLEFLGQNFSYPFHRKRVSPDFFGINVYCLEGFEIEGIPVRANVGAGMA